MIIIGYQGIGKSTLAGTGKFIDLESGNFWVDGYRAEDWYKPYCQIAEHLSKQGFIVFTSSHEVVRKQLRDSTETVFVCYPSLELNEEWIQKLEDRYERTKLEKDFKALANAKDRYRENIQELMNEDKFHHICINSIPYNLQIMIEYSCNSNTEILKSYYDYATISSTKNNFDSVINKKSPAELFAYENKSDESKEPVTITIYNSEGKVIKTYNGDFTIVEHSHDKLKFQDKNSKKRHYISIRDGFVTYDEN